MIRELAQRSPEALETIQGYIKPDNVARDEDGELVERQIPAEVATTSVDGVIKVYGTRDVEGGEELEARQIPAEVATTALDGVIKVYGTREVGEESVELVGRQDEVLPEEVPTTSVNGIIELYRAREIGDDSSELVARQADIPAEVATTSVDGVIKVYDGTLW